MRHGIDCGFLVAAELAEHPGHASARAELARLLSAGERLALAPQVLAEFIHIVTDPRRFTQPLEIGEARRLAGQWWTARDVDQVFPDEAAVRQFFAWLEQHRLGRKRLLDTLLAATYRVANIASILTTDPHDFTVLGGFTCIVPSAPTPSP